MKGIESIADSDVVIIFYNASSKIFIKDIITFKNIIDRVQFQMMRHAGPNYLDFYLSATVGMLAKSDPEACIVMISKDKGYNSVLDFCNDNGFNCSKFPSIETHISYINFRQNKESVAEIEENEISVDMPSVTVTDDENNDKGNEVLTPEDTTSNADISTINTTVNDTKRTVPESIRKKVRAALKKDKVETHKYTQIYKAFLANSKKEYLEKLTGYFGTNIAQNYYQKTLAFFREFNSDANVNLG